MLNFYKISEVFLEKLADRIEKEDLESVFDVEYADGILTIMIHASGLEYIINRHSANQKIWYSSPISGADYFSFDLVRNDWINQNEVTLVDKLFLELASFKN